MDPKQAPTRAVFKVRSSKLVSSSVRVVTPRQKSVLTLSAAHISAHKRLDALGWLHHRYRIAIERT